MPPQPDPDSSDEGVPPLTDNDSKIENILNGDEEDDDDEDSKDEPLWNSGMLKCKSLFDSEEFESAEDCLEYCQKVHNFNIKVQAEPLEPLELVASTTCNLLKRYITCIPFISL